MVGSRAGFRRRAPDELKERRHEKAIALCHGRLSGARHAREGRHHPEARRGDHEPRTHGDTEGDRCRFREGQSGNARRDHISSVGPGFRKVCHDGLGRRYPRRGGDARPLACALRRHRAARESRALSRQMGPDRGAQRPRAGDGPLLQQDSLHGALRLLPAGLVLQQDPVQAGWYRQAAGDHGRVRRRREEDLGPARQIRLLPARRARRPQRLDDV